VPWGGGCPHEGCVLKAKHAGECKLGDVAEEDYEVEYIVDEEKRGRKSLYHVASAFAIEATDEGLPVPFGMHAAHKYLPRDRVEELLRVAARAYGMLR